MDSIVWRRTIGVFVVLAASMQVRASEPVVNKIRQTGILHCGTDQSEAEYSLADIRGSRVAFDTDICRAVAIAIAGPSARVDLKGYPDQDTALNALRRGEIDLVPTVSADTHAIPVGVGVSAPVLYDGISFLVPQRSPIKHAGDLGGKKICLLAETEVEVSVRAWFLQRHLDFVPFPFQEEGEMEAAFVTGNCAALAGNLTRLGNSRVAFGKAASYLLLPEVISTDPMVIAYRQDEPALSRDVQDVLDVLLEAEANGITAKTIRPGMDDRPMRKLLDESQGTARRQGLDEGWAVNVIQAVGNYAEIFQRDLGSGAPLDLPRGLNALRINGGLMPDSFAGAHSNVQR
jgi:general L-amino acid transport system substrate-binding protein